MTVRFIPVQAAVWPDTCDHLRTVIAHHGEDAALVLQEYRRLHPDHGHVGVVFFAHGAAPRPELSTKASLSTGLAAAQSMIATLPANEANSLRHGWVVACEGLSVACNKELGVK